MKIVYEYLIGKAMQNYIQKVSELRIQEFQNYPYLYKGNLEYEKEYMLGFSSDPHSCLGLAKYENEIIGISTGMPLKSEADILKDAENVYHNANRDPCLYYYFGEFIILPQYRGKGIAKHLSLGMESVARKFKYSRICLLTVLRSDDDQRKPTNYKSIDPICYALGFKPDKLSIDYHWPTILENGDVKDVLNPMIFWSKEINK